MLFGVSFGTEDIQILRLFPKLRGFVEVHLFVVVSLLHFDALS